jgi:transposase InsO family protein
VWIGHATPTSMRSMVPVSNDLVCNGVIERFFGTLKYGHLFRGPINDGDALAVEVGRFRQVYSTVRPQQTIGDRTPRDAYLAGS